MLVGASERGEPAGGLPEPAHWRAEVVDVAALTPSVRHVRLALTPEAGGDAYLEHLPGQDMSLSLLSPGGAQVHRRYTIRRALADGRSVDLEVVLHGDGPGARWASGAAVGDTVGAIGPRGKVTVVAGPSTHLFVCDEASLPASCSMLEALPEGSRAILLAGVADASERRAVEAPDGVRLDLRWLDRAGLPPSAPELAVAALEDMELDPSDTHAYLLGEHHVVAAVRAALAPRLGAEMISSKSYWRADRANAGHGEPPRDA